MYDLQGRIGCWDFQRVKSKAVRPGKIDTGCRQGAPDADEMALTTQWVLEHEVKPDDVVSVSITGAGGDISWQEAMGLPEKPEKLLAKPAIGVGAVLCGRVARRHFTVVGVRTSDDALRIRALDGGAPFWMSRVSVERDMQVVGGSYVQFGVNEYGEKMGGSPFEKKG